jgi:hypothetical protein
MGRRRFVESNLFGSLGAAIRTAQPKGIIRVAVGGICSSCGCPGADRRLEQTEREDDTGDPGSTRGQILPTTWTGHEPAVVPWETNPD